MQALIQYEKNTKLNQSSKTELGKTKTFPLWISSEDLVGLSWIFLDEDFTSPIRVGN